MPIDSNINTNAYTNIWSPMPMGYKPVVGSGSIGEATARKNARRGGTPNAPEVNDEMAPTGPTNISGVNNGIAAPLPGNAYANAASFPQPTDVSTVQQQQQGPVAIRYSGGDTGDGSGMFRKPFEVYSPQTANEGGISRGYPVAGAPAPAPVAPAVATPGQTYDDQVSRAAGRTPVQYPQQPGQPQQPPADNGGIAAPGPIANAVATVPNNGLTDAQRSTQQIRESSNSLDLKHAQDAADIQSRSQMAYADANRADAWQARERLNGTAAQFASHGGPRAQRAYENSVAMADRNLSAANTERAGAGVRDPLADLRSGRETVDQSNQAGITLEQGKQNIAQANALNPVTAEAARLGVAHTGVMNPLTEEAARTAGAGGKLALEGQARIAEVAGRLKDETDPKKIDLLSRQIAGLMGKDRPDQYKAHVVHGEEVTDPLTGARTKSADRLFVVGPDGRAEEPTAGQVSAAAGGGTAPLPNHVAALKAGKVTPEQFDAKYGKGAAARASKGQ